MRTPTSGRPAVTASGTASVRGSSSVSGPGQNAFISFCAALGTSRTTARSIAFSAVASPAMCTITGSHDGRCLAAKIFATAAASSAFAPSPYTVSVGSATSPPARRISAARSNAARASGLSSCAGFTASRSVFTSPLSPLCPAMASCRILLATDADRNGN